MVVRRLLVTRHLTGHYIYMEETNPEVVAEEVLTEVPAPVEAPATEATA